MLSECFKSSIDESRFYDLSLTATSNEGCVAEHKEDSYIAVHHNPIADFYYKPEEPSVLENEVKFYNISSNADSYDWFFGDLGSSTDYNPIFTFLSVHGTHGVVLLAKTQENCVDTLVQTLKISDEIIFY